jgi:hypothetical protein
MVLLEDKVGMALVEDIRMMQVVLFVVLMGDNHMMEVVLLHGMMEVVLSEMVQLEGWMEVV